MLLGAKPPHQQQQQQQRAVGGIDLEEIEKAPSKEEFRIPTPPAAAVKASRSVLPSRHSAASRAPPSLTSSPPSRHAAAIARFPPCTYCRKVNHAETECHYRPNFCKDCKRVGHKPANCPRFPPNANRISLGTSSTRSRSSGNRSQFPVSRTSCQGIHRRSSERGRRRSSSPPPRNRKYQLPFPRRRSREVERISSRRSNSSGVNRHSHPGTSSSSSRPVQDYVPAPAAAQYVAPQPYYAPPEATAAAAATPKFQCRFDQIPPNRADMHVILSKLQTAIASKAEPQKIAPLCSLVNEMQIRDGDLHIVLPASGTMGYETDTEFATVDDIVAFLGLLDTNGAFEEAKKRVPDTMRIYEPMQFVRAGNRDYPVPHEFAFHHPLLQHPLVCRIDRATASLDSLLEFSCHFDGVKLSSASSSEQALLDALKAQRFHIRQPKCEVIKEFRLEKLEQSDVICIVTNPAAANNRIVTKFLATHDNTPNVGDQLWLMKSSTGDWKKSLAKGDVPTGLAFRPGFQSFCPLQYLADLIEVQNRHGVLDSAISNEIYGLGIAHLWTLEASFRAPFLHHEMEHIASFRLLGIAKEDERVKLLIDRALQFDSFRFNAWRKMGYEVLDGTVWKTMPSEYVI